MGRCISSWALHSTFPNILGHFPQFLHCGAVCIHILSLIFPALNTFSSSLEVRVKQQGELCNIL